MAFKKPVVNRVVADIKNLSIYLRSVRKFGKTTLFRDVVIEKYNDPERGLLIGCGAEQGYTLLDNLNTTQVETWKDLVDLKQWLIKEKGNEHNIEALCFDVGDEILPIAEKEVIRLSNIENPKKQCKTVNGAFGGYGAGTQKVVELVKDYFVELKKAGFFIMVLGHTKLKSIKEKSAIDDGYQALASVLTSNYEAIFSDIFDCVLTGYIDKGIESETVEVAGQEKIVKHATACERRLYFRGTEFIEAGCRFKADTVPEYLLFDKSNMAKEFIETLENGMKESATMGVVKQQQKTVLAEEEFTLEVEEETTDEKISETTLNAEEILNDIRPLFKVATADQKKIVKEILAKHGEKALNTNTKIEALQEVLVSLK